MYGPLRQMRVQNGRFLIAGGAGLIGVHLAEQLVAEGAKEIIIFDSLALSSDSRLQSLIKRWGERVRFVRGDVLQLPSLMDALDGVDGVYLIAGYLTLALAANPWAGLDVNVRGVQNVLEACRWQGVKKVVFSSTVAVYGGASESPITEETPFVFGSGLQWPPLLYGATKIIGEQLCRRYASEYGIEYVALRYGTVYGEGQHRRGVNVLYMIDAIDRILQGKPPHIPGDGKEAHDYVYVGDVARANVMAMERDVANDAFNIVSGKAISVNGLVDLVLRVMDSPLKPEYVPRAGSISYEKSPDLCYSRRRAEEKLGWVPRVHLEDGIRRMVAWRSAAGQGNEQG